MYYPADFNFKDDLLDQQKIPATSQRQGSLGHKKLTF
jgi:hypothetical protein